jgi:D-alanine-D-alanine ligase
MTGPNKPAEFVILHGVSNAAPSPDDVDTLLQVQVISAALREDGHRVRELAVDLDLHAVSQLHEQPGCIVFNLVESLAGQGSLAHLPIALLETLRIPFTGSSARTLTLTTDKPLSKRLLRSAGLPTPDWWERSIAPDDRLVIVKPSHEDGSVGITAASVMRGSEFSAALDDQNATPVFAEAYIEGREFNVSLLATNTADGSGVEVLPVAEIRFVDFPPDRPRILDYEAKWAPDSAAYRGTVRHTLGADEETELSARLRAIARQVWTLFEMRGYARVDFRVDASGQAWIVDINANPCLAPDAGFVAAATAAGLNFADVIRRIVVAAIAPARPAAAHKEPEPATEHLQRHWRADVQQRDIEAVHALLGRTGVFSAEEQAVAAELVETTLQQGAAAGYEFIFAETGDKLDAYACFGAIPGAPGRYDLYWIAVCPDTRRQGLGREVLARIEQVMRDAGASRVYLDTAGRAAYRPTHAFYHSCGYRTIAELEDYYAAGDNKLILMKELTGG